jgi:uncharacterized membrane protein YgcG
LASIRYIVGLIESASVSEPANASGIAYTISYIDEGGGIVQAQNQAPSYPRYADFDATTQTGCYVNPFPAGQVVIGLMLDSRLYWLFNELPAIAGCGTTNGGMLMMRDPITGELVPVVPSVPGIPTVFGQGTVTGGTGGGGADGAPAGGGGEI